MTQAEVRAANRRMRAADESHLWPISGKFSATNRAIATVLKGMVEGLCIETVEEYESAVDAEIGRIVNDEDNW